MFMSPPVWRATVCSSPWGSPAAPPLLSGWISLKSMSTAANRFMHWEMEDFSISHQISCAVFSPAELLPPFLPWLSSVVPFIACCQPCLCSPASPRNAGWALFHRVLLQLCQTAFLPSSIQNPSLSHHWQNSSDVCPHLSDFSPCPRCAFPSYTSPLHQLPGLAPLPALPMPCHPVPAFPAPSPQHCIPIDMPGLDRIAGLSLFSVLYPWRVFSLMQSSFSQQKELLWL